MQFLQLLPAPYPSLILPAIRLLTYQIANTVSEKCKVTCLTLCFLVLFAFLFWHIILDIEMSSFNFLEIVLSFLIQPNSEKKSETTQILCTVLF